MDSEKKMVDAALLRSKVHQMLARAEKDHVVTMYDKGFRYALIRVMRLIDKMTNVKETKE